MVALIHQFSPVHSCHHKLLKSVFFLTFYKFSVPVLFKKCSHKHLCHSVPPTLSSHLVACLDHLFLLHKKVLNDWTVDPVYVIFFTICTVLITTLTFTLFSFIHPFIHLWQHLPTVFRWITKPATFVVD